MFWEDYLLAVIETYLNANVAAIGKMEKALVEYPEITSLGLSLSENWYFKWRFITVEKAS